MAKKQQPIRTAAPPPAGATTGAQKAILLLCGLAIVPFAMPTLMLLFFGMLPTMVAAMVDRGPHRYAWLCVGGLNFSGISPYLFELWKQGHTLDAAFAQLTNVLALLVIYGAASFGWVVYMMMPPVVGAFLQVAAQRRIGLLRANQKKLVEQWGPDVAHPETV